MNLNNLTLKSQETVQAAQRIASEKGHQQIENEHLFQALLDVDENVLPVFIQKITCKFWLVKTAKRKSTKKLFQGRRRSTNTLPKGISNPC